MQIKDLEDKVAELNEEVATRDNELVNRMRENELLKSKVAGSTSSAPPPGMHLSQTTPSPFWQLL